ncbi:hypothetical protein PV726_31105 [Streptomyces europaeiscabiei]|uniref:hypothetical protein n=1 Tax=Streptomyces europaeiscabiei TaxID=146819 RepID=UPI0029A9117F|nr:hypothetical protein [Streptomyces europaeiscabiei]MDX3694702.1 hypothetical protein [Streptomyces europaeiscabiei]
MRNSLIPTVTALDDAAWLGKNVTDHLGRPGTVRRVYDVAGEQVAILTSELPASEDTDAIWGEHVALLATDSDAPAFPDFLARRNELVALERTVFSGDATEDEARRYRDLADIVGRYQGAEGRLCRALFSTAQSGDRVYLTGKGMFATIVDPDPEPSLDGLRLYVRARLDEIHLRKDPHLLRAHPGGVLDLSTLLLFPTLGLV